MDAITISLCLSLFDWAKYKTAKGAVKLHTLLDYDGNLPAYVNITNGKIADNKGAYDVPLHKGSVIVADWFYNDFALLNVWDSSGVFFVIRYKENLQYTSLKENVLPENRHKNILIDEIIELKIPASKKNYPRKLRRRSVWGDKNEHTIEVITNQMSWTASTISELYKSRWQIEIFFREIKQNLHIKSFIGTTENALMMQIWTALITILILKAFKVVFNLFVKINLENWLDRPFEEPHQLNDKQSIQGVLF